MLISSSKSKESKLAIKPKYLLMLAKIINTPRRKNLSKSQNRFKILSQNTNKGKKNNLNQFRIKQ